MQPQPQRASVSGSVLIGSGLGVSTQGEVRTLYPVYTCVGLSVCWVDEKRCG